MNHVVSWFSCGAASAVATKLALSTHSNVDIAYTEVVNEHPDNKRFLSDCERWFGQKIIVLRNEEYGADIREVFRRERFIVGPKGAPCTRLLKRQMRVFFEEEDDLQVFGFTVEETERAERLLKNNPYIKAKFPLIEHGLSKGDCLAMIDRAGIDIPAMYRLGYRNNNCIGCVKGGAGYWNKIRVDFPVQFAERAADERLIGHSILKKEIGTKDGKRIFAPLFLDELPPDAGAGVPEPDMECSFFCQMAEDVFIETAREGENNASK